jgi:POT family proton-dependent oligopeptide transporter
MMSTTSQGPSASGPQPTLFGHPTGLYTLFFAEMWERFSYYGMRALLVFYMIKGFLSYDDEQAYAVYGAYTALVYATPFVGGMLADRILGARRSVVLGGLLMAAGHLTMTIEHPLTFFVALGLLICGNGFFKPNISTIVGSLYPEGSTKRDGGFTVFYMGINLGAAMSPLLCGYIGETYGWHYGFGLATIGMLVGLAVFVAPRRLTQVLILLGALGTAASLALLEANVYLRAVNGFVAAALVVAGIVATVALQRGGLPSDAGAPPSQEKLKQKVGGLLRADALIYAGAMIVVPLLALFVWLHSVAGVILAVFGGGALVYILIEALRSPKIERERLFVVLVLMFFSMLFWAFFEQAGSSVSNFTDRNVDRVLEERRVEASDVGSTITMDLSQEQFGRTNGERTVTMTDYANAVRRRDDETRPDPNAMRLEWQVSQDDVGMGVVEPGHLSDHEIPATVFQAANPIFILLFGLLFTALWGFLGNRGLEPNTPLKFALGLLQLGLGFGAFWYGATVADDRGMVFMGWLLLGYLLHTTGELCISPVGLSMVTKLSPHRMVATVMGGWFLATAFSNYLAGLIAQLTGVGGEGGEERVVPPPGETLHVYGDVFLKIAIAAAVSAVIVGALSPLLKKWMHEGEHEAEAPPGPKKF